VKSGTAAVRADPTRRGALQLDIIVPVVMSCALLWWVSRSMSWTTRLVVTVITLVVIICIVLFERSGLYTIPWRK
jgi:hypothetical protein